MNNMLKVGVGVASTIMVLLMGMFLVVLYDQTIDEYLIGTLDNVSQSFASEIGLGVGYEETLTSLKTSYDNRSIPFDIFFVLMFSIAFVSLIKVSIETRKAGIFTFFGYLFLGSMLFLLTMFFIAQFTDYFLFNIYVPLFADSIIDTPIMFWFFSNVKLIAFLMFLTAGLINQFDFVNVARDLGDKFSGGLQR